MLCVRIADLESAHAAKIAHSTMIWDTARFESIPKESRFEFLASDYREAYELLFKHGWTEEDSISDMMEMRVYLL